MNRYYKGILLIVLSAMGYGAMPIFAVYAYRSGISVLTLLFIRFTLAAMLLFLYIFIKTGKISITSENLLSLLVLGGVCYTLQSTCYFSAVKYISPSLTGLILYAYPAFVYILSIIIDKEKISKKVAISILISMLGLMLILGTSIGKLNLLGVLFAAAASLVYTCYIILGNRVVKKASPIVTTAFVMLFAAAGLLTLGLATNSINFSFRASVWLPIAGLVLFSTILSILAFFRGLEVLGSTKSSVLSILEPVFIIIFSTIILNDRLSILQIAGGIAVLGGAALVASHREKKIE